MADTTDRTSRSHDAADGDDMSFLLQHLFSSTSSTPSHSNSRAHTPPPSDVALVLAARRATASLTPWTEAFPHLKTSPDRPTPLPLDRDRTSTAESSAVGIHEPPPLPFFLPYSAESQSARSAFADAEYVASADCDATSFKRGRGPSSSAADTDFDDYDCESEEGVDASEELPRSTPARTASKRSRAAEVHNLSEKRRRSRINEKMKALQNLIPNSNKTDKASMLDEAIEYLKQLQLQVQMLSMRNGLSLHPMYLAGSLQPLQIPQMTMGFGAGNDSLHMNMGVGMLSLKQDPTTQTSYGLSNRSISSNQPPLIPGLCNITTSETFRDLSPSQDGSFQLTTASEEAYEEDIIPQRQLDANQSIRYLSGGGSN